MVGHDYISMYLAAMLVAGCCEFFKIELIVSVRAVYFAAVVASHYDVLWLIGDDESG